MTMKFRTVKAAIEKVLNDNAQGRFRVIGYQERMVDASDNLAEKRSVQVFYNRGDFSNGNMVGPYEHKMTFHVEINASRASEGDVDALENASTPAAVEAAMSTFLNAAKLADDSWDEVFDHVFQIVMSPIYMDFELEPTDDNPTGFLLSSRRITEVKKDSPLSWGEFVMVTGGFDIECKVTEIVTGETAEELLTTSTQIDIVDDDVEQTGVEVTEE